MAGVHVRPSAGRLGLAWLGLCAWCRVRPAPVWAIKWECVTIMELHKARVLVQAACIRASGAYACISPRAQSPVSILRGRTAADATCCRHSKRYIEVLYEKELGNWLCNSLEHDRKFRRLQVRQYLVTPLHALLFIGRDHRQGSSAGMHAKTLSGVHLCARTCGGRAGRLAAVWLPGPTARVGLLIPNHSPD